MRRFLTIFLGTILLTSSAWGAPVLDGREVFLIVSAERNDLDGEWMELAIRGIRHDIGMTASQLPVVRMGIADSDADDKYFQRLGLSPNDIPALCVVRWSDEAALGPKQILQGQVVRRASRDKGLKKPKALFRQWLIEHGELEMADKLTDPVPEDELERQPSPNPERTSEPVFEMTAAEVALAERRYPEAIQLARDSGETIIETEARQAFHQQGALAIAEGQPDLALSVYQKLQALYPKNIMFHSKVEDLTRDPNKPIIGHWKMNSTSAWVEFTAHADGKLTGKAALFAIPVAAKMEGHWLLTGDKERTFQLHWKNGALHNVKVHENLQTLQGQDLHGEQVSGQRLE